jgi:hypothetical protein
MNASLLGSMLIGQQMQRSMTLARYWFSNPPKLTKVQNLGVRPTRLSLTEQIKRRISLTGTSAMPGS